MGEAATETKYPAPKADFGPEPPRWFECLPAPKPGFATPLHFLADPGELDALRQDCRFAPSPHHGYRGWLAVRLDTGEIEWDELTELLQSAHRQVAPGPDPA